jgi:hypothetical protein
MPNRDIDDVTWQRLQKWAIPLDDDLDSVLCRILDVAEEHLLCDTSQPHPLSLKPGFLKVEARLVPENAPLDNGKTVDQLDGILPDQLLHELDRNDLLSFCNGLDGQYLMTSGRGVKFRFEFSPRHFFYTPVSTSTRRSQQISYFWKVVDNFEKTGSFRPTDYTRVSRNASYALTLISLYLNPKALEA